MRGIVVEATWKATPIEKMKQEATRPMRRPKISPNGEAVRAPKKVPADKIETISEVWLAVSFGVPIVLVANSF